MQEIVFYKLKIYGRCVVLKLETLKVKIIKILLTLAFGIGGHFYSDYLVRVSGLDIVVFVIMGIVIGAIVFLIWSKEIFSNKITKTGKTILTILLLPASGFLFYGLNGLTVFSWVIFIVLAIILSSTLLLLWS